MTIKRSEEEVVFTGRQIRKTITNNLMGYIEDQMSQYEDNNIYVFADGDSIHIEHSSCEDDLIVMEAENTLIGLIV